MLCSSFSRTDKDRKLFGEQRMSIGIY